MTVTIYHNPRCSKSRQTLKLLEDRGIQPRVVEYLRSPPSTAELSRILTLLGMQPRQLLRGKESAYREAGLDDDSLSTDEVIARMVENPILIERPIVLANGRAAVGRPPENVLKIL